MSNLAEAPLTFAAEREELINSMRGKSREVVLKVAETFIFGDSVRAFFAVEDVISWGEQEFVWGVFESPSPRTGAAYGMWFETAVFELKCAHESMNRRGSDFVQNGTKMRADWCHGCGEELERYAL